MSTSYGEIYAAQEFKIEIRETGDNMVRYDDRVAAKINGGGMKFRISIPTTKNLSKKEIVKSASSYSSSIRTETVQLCGLQPEGL